MIVDDEDVAFLCQGDQGFVVWDGRPGDGEEDYFVVWVQLGVHELGGGDVRDQFHGGGVPDFDGLVEAAGCE